MAQLAPLLLLLLAASCGPASGADPETILFSFITSFGRFGFNSSGVVPAVDLALEEINARGLLPGYELRYHSVLDSECNREFSLKAFTQDVFSGQARIAVIGCGCSVATEPVAEISHFWNISQIAPNSAASTLSDRSRFKNFFRTTPTFENFVPSLLSVLQNFRWTRIQFITQNENLFLALLTDLMNFIETYSICCFDQTMNYTLASETFETDSSPIPALDNAMDSSVDHRVFFINSYSGPARLVICEAFKRRLFGPRYVWITHGWYPDRWWTQEVTNNTVNCTESQLEEFLVQGRVIALTHLTTPDDRNAMTDQGTTPNMFQDIYESRVVAQNYTLNNEADIAYDAVWALAFALNRTNELVARGNVSESGCDLEGELVPLHMFNYSNALLGCVIRWSLEQTNFTGVSGNVAFEADGDRVRTNVRLQQYRNDLSFQQLDIGISGSDSNFSLVYFEGENDLTVFPDGIPSDGTPIKVTRSYKTGLVITYYTVAGIGVVFTCVCLAFNCLFRNRKVIKLTSPNLNYLIAGGALLMFLSVYIQLIPTTNATVVYIQCIVHAWLYFTGYLLAFGTTLAKMWRVYHIFRDPSPSKKTLKDWHMVLIALVITGVGVAVLVIRSGLQRNPPRNVTDAEESEGQTSLGIRVMFCVFNCYTVGDGAFYFDIIVFVYLGILQIVGIILAFQTRNVQITVLNESKFVAAFVYFSSIVLVALVIVTFALASRINVAGGIFSGGILLLATMSLALTFVPKMIYLYLDPNGDKVFQSNAQSQAASVMPKHTSINLYSLPSSNDRDEELKDSDKLKSIEKEDPMKDREKEELKDREKEELKEALLVQEESNREKDNIIKDLQRALAAASSAEA